MCLCVCTKKKKQKKNSWTFKINVYTSLFILLLSTLSVPDVLDCPTIPSHIYLQLHGKYGISHDHDVMR